MNTSYRIIYDQLYSNKYNALCLGNSHAHYAVNPTFFNNYQILNFANLSQSCFYEKAVLSDYLENSDHNIKFAFISVDYHTFYHTTSGDLRDLMMYYSTGIKPLGTKPITYFLSPFFSYSGETAYGLLKTMLKDKLNDISIIDIEDKGNTSCKIIDGYIGLRGSKDHLFNITNYKKEIHAYNRLIEKKDKKGVQVIKQMIELLKQNNIQPILFTSPTFIDYNRCLSKDILSDNNMIIKELVKQYDIPYWNYRQLDLKQEYFFNAGHLNNVGAKKFTLILNDRLNSINLKD